jgi:hypothetical protein
MSYQNQEPSLKSFSNPFLPFMKVFIPLALIPGIALILLSSINFDTTNLIIGVFVLVLGPLSMFAIDFFLRPRIVDLRQNDVILIFSSRRRIMIPYTNIEIHTVPGSPLMGGVRGNIRDREKSGISFSVSFQIVEGIQEELKARRIIRAHKIAKS